MNGKHENRVLGRVLAVEEAMNVSGARPTLPLYDLSSACLETSTVSECGRTPAANGALASSSNTGTILTQISGS